MVNYMKEAFGKQLLADYMDGNPNNLVLPSPEVI